jgi:hypothetical protein
MTFANASPYAAVAVPTIAADGREIVLAVVKATFALARNRRLVFADEQAPVRLGDVVSDPDAHDSSVQFPSDVGLEKPAVDVVVVGDAIAPKPVQVLDIGVRVGERTAPLRVHGERVFYRAVGRIAVGPAAPFERKPVVYEKAYGGATADFRVIERRNPVGRGVTESAADLVDTEAPSIEHPAHPITSAADTPEPMGYGAIATHWQPRCDFAGTFDDTWRETRLPLLPLDFDARFWNVAHPSLQFDTLLPGEVIAVLGMWEEGVFQFELPEVRTAFSALTDDGRRLWARPSVDTVLIEPNDGRVELTARAVFPRGRGRTLLREIRLNVDD